MAERVNKLIFEAEVRAGSGDLSATVTKVDQLSAAVGQAKKGTLELVEAEKKLEQASNQAGVAVTTETKKVSEFTAGVNGAKKAVDGIAQANGLKDSFKVTNLDQFNVKLKEFQKNVIALAVSGDKLHQIPVEIEKMVQAIEGLNDEDAAFALEEMGKEATRLQKLLDNPTRRLRELKRLINTTDDPELLKQLQLEAGKLNDELGDTNELVRALSSDTFIADTAVETVETAVGAFSALQGVIALTSDGNEELARAAARAQGALALLQGTQQVLNQFKKEDNVITRLQIVGQRAYAAVVGQSTGAMKGFRLALAATGIGLLIVGIAALVANFDKLKSVLGLGVNPETEKYIKNSERALEVTRRQSEALDDNLKIYRAVADGIKLANKDITQGELERLESEKDFIAQEQELRAKELSELETNVKLQKQKFDELAQARAKSIALEAAARSNPISAIGAAFSSSVGASQEEVEEQRKLLDERIARQRELQAATVTGNNTLVELEKQKNDLIREQNKKAGDDRLKVLGEEERFALAMAGIQKKSTEDLLNIQLDFAKKRLAIQQTIPGFDKTAIQQTKNGITELTEQLGQLVDGSIRDLSDKYNALRNKIVEGLKLGTPEFDAAVKELQIAKQELDAANAVLDPEPIEQFAEGSLKAMRKQVDELSSFLEGLAEGSNAFAAVSAALEEARKALKELEDRIGEDAEQRQRDQNEAIRSEQERHEIAMRQINGNSQEAILEAQRRYAVQRLNEIKANNEATEAEILAAENAILEIDAEIANQRKENRKKEFLAAVENTQLIVNAAAQAAATFINIEKAKNDQLIQLQEERVKQAEAIADRGNVALLEAEQRRLDDLNRKRERFVRQQQRLAQIELVANSMIAIAKAAAQGGAAAPFTIAATLIALAAGLAQARASASAQSFRKGGVSKGGFTGYGPPDGQSMAQGPRPYVYHNQEHITPHEVLKIGNNKDWLERIRLNKIDIGKMMTENKSSSPIIINDYTELIDAVKNIPGAVVNFDKNGMIEAYYQSEKKRKRIKSKTG